MNIDCKALLPTSPACDHSSVAWETTTAEDPPDHVSQTVEVPEGTPGAHSIEASVNCKQCPATAVKTLYFVWVTD